MLELQNAALFFLLLLFDAMMCCYRAEHVCAAGVTGACCTLLVLFWWFDETATSCCVGLQQHYFLPRHPEDKRTRRSCLRWVVHLPLSYSPTSVLSCPLYPIVVLVSCSILSLPLFVLILMCVTRWWHDMSIDRTFGPKRWKCGKKVLDAEQEQTSNVKLGLVLILSPNTEHQTPTTERKTTYECCCT